MTIGERGTKLPLDDLDRAQRDELGRRYVESAEWWLRRLIHHQLATAFGNAYISAGPLSQRIKQPIVEKMKQLSERVAREVDATTFDQAIDIVCHPERWSSHFAPAMTSAYPLGQQEARFFLDQVKAIRNDLSHGRSISTRQLEKGICYTNDLADAIKAFFRGIGMSHDYDVPMIVRYIDSLGNESHLTDLSTDINVRIIDWRGAGKADLFPGDRLVAEIEVDPSYSASAFSVQWSIYGAIPKHGDKAVIDIGVEHVSQQVELTFQVRTDREWHRQFDLDDALTVIFRVLPPLLK